MLLSVIIYHHLFIPCICIYRQRAPHSGSFSQSGAGEGCTSGWSDDIRTFFDKKATESGRSGYFELPIGLVANNARICHTRIRSAFPGYVFYPCF